MKIVFVFVISLLLFSCTHKPKVEYIEKPVFIKCQIPDIPKAELEPIPDNVEYSKKLEVILNNCLKVKQENELLREALELCK